MTNKTRNMILALGILSSLSLRWPDDVLLPVLEPIVAMPDQNEYLKTYLLSIALRESNNKPHIVSRLGYLGKYQFNRNTLWGLGKKFQVSKRDFLNNEELQDSAMVGYLRHNYVFLSDIIARYNGRTVNGIKMTTSGILAGAHLIGPSGVVYYFDRSFRINRNGKLVIPKLADSNGTHVEEYFEKFAGYEITFALE